MKRNILLIETATSSCSVALGTNGEVVAVRELNEPNVHARLSTVFIEEALAAAGWPASRLNAVAVSMGPGSYTGLRIGVSVAKGLCYALDIPLIAINTLQSMSAGYLMANKVDPGDLLVPMVDARRMEAYSAVFKVNLDELDPTASIIPDALSFQHYEGRKILFGDGALKFGEMFEMRPDIVVKEFVNSATHLAALADHKLKLGQTENLAYFEPYYLKEFLATIPRNQRDQSG